jgi:hypothetical protein
MGAGGPPVFSNNPGEIRVINREYIGEITATTAFNFQSFGINPGSSALFPWLSGIASNFQMYEFHGLIFKYEQRSGTAIGSTNTSLGTVVMTTQYDPLAAPFLTKQQMEAYEFTTADAPDVDIIHPVECAVKDRPLKDLYVRTRPLQNSGFIDTPRFTDWGTFFIATQGMQQQCDIGELWVSYDVKLTKPIAAPPGATEEYYHYSQTGATNSSRLGNASAGSVISSLPTVSVADDNAFQFNTAGLAYIIIMTWTAGTAISSDPGFTLGGNITAYNLFAGDTVTDVAVFGDGGATASMVIAINVLKSGTGTNNEVDVTGLATMSAGKVDVIILPFPLGLSVFPYTTSGLLSHNELKYLTTTKTSSSSKDESKEFHMVQEEPSPDYKPSQVSRFAEAVLKQKQSIPAIVGNVLRLKR